MLVVVAAGVLTVVAVIRVMFVNNLQLLNNTRFQSLEKSFISLGLVNQVIKIVVVLRVPVFPGVTKFSFLQHVHTKSKTFSPSSFANLLVQLSTN